MLPTFWRSKRTRFGVLSAIVAAATAVGVLQPAAGAIAHTTSLPAFGQWPVAGQNLSDTHNQAAEYQVSPANVGKLAPKWTLTTNGNMQGTPTVADGVVYVPDQGGTLWAVNASTGKVLWSNPISAYTGIAGDLSRTSPAIYGNELISGEGWTISHPVGSARIFAADRLTGKPLWTTVVDTHPTAIITSSPTVYNGVAYVGISSSEEGAPAFVPGYPCCTFRGAVVALDAGTGRLLWKTYTVPSNNDGGDVNVPGGYSGAAVWGSSPAIDPRLGLLYIGTGNNYNVPQGVCSQPNQTGCTPTASNDYEDSILALRMSDGAIVWAVRTDTGDVSTLACGPTSQCGPDSDFGTAVNLFTVINPATGRLQELAGIGQKSGIYWAVDARTGKIVWTTQVGPGGEDGGMEWGTATDGRHIFVAEADSEHVAYQLGGSGPEAGQTVTGGSWAELDAATGKIIWQTADPQGAADIGYVSTANGVVYAGSNAGTGNNMYALSAATGKILWSFASGGAVQSGAAIVNGTILWGSGYYTATCPSDQPNCGGNNKLYAFGVG
jgi:polyvinyl alcohol dehydrogenase (cytochrome)